jgi:hypothetical protein
MRRALWVLPLLALGHLGAWLWLGERLRGGLEAWVAARRAEGWTVSHGVPARSGWPWRVALRVPAPRLAKEGLGWQAETLDIALDGPWLDRLRLTPGGAQALHGPDLALPLAGEALALTVTLAADPLTGLPRETHLNARALHLRLPAGPQALEAAAATLVPDAAGTGPPGLVLRGALTIPAAGAARPAQGPDPAQPTAPPAAAMLAFDLRLSGPLGVGAGRPPAAWAASWRDAGGELAVRSLSLRWGEATAQLVGRLRLDEALQPAGAGRLAILRAAAALEAAAEAGLIGRGEAALAGGLLWLQQRPAAEGPPRVELPVVLQRRSLSLGGLPLGRLPAMTWPAGAP